MYTTEEIKRKGLVKLFDDILAEKRVFLDPISIECKETFEPKTTTTDIVFQETSSQKSVTHKILGVVGSGMVGCVFSACLELYEKEYPSLNNIELVDLLIKPAFNMSTLSHNTEAEVILKMKVAKRGVSEFRNKSKSLVASSYDTVLSAFQFYINCEKSFNRLDFLLSDASKRNRGDLAGNYIHKMADLAEVNSFEKR